MDEGSLQYIKIFCYLQQFPLTRREIPSFEILFEYFKRYAEFPYSHTGVSLTALSKLVTKSWHGRGFFDKLWLATRCYCNRLLTTRVRSPFHTR